MKESIDVADAEANWRARSYCWGTNMKADTPGKLAMPATLPLLFVAVRDVTSWPMAVYSMSHTAKVSFGF